MNSTSRRDFVQKCFAQSAKNTLELADSNETIDALCAASRMIVEAYLSGGCLFVAGNGGSAADAQHLVAELVSKLSTDRTPIRAFALTVDTSILTAIGNDYGYEKTFSRQVCGLMRHQDVLLAITTSGKSPNILAALAAAREIGAKTVVLTGRDGGSTREMADLAIIAPGLETANIQECHLVIYHTLCRLIEADLVHSGLCRYV